MPLPLLEGWKEELPRLEDPILTSSEKLSLVLNLLGQLDDFQQKVTLNETVMTLTDGKEHLAKQVFLGLRHGWYVTADKTLFRMPPLLPALAEQVAAAMKQGASSLDSLKEKVKGLQKELLQIALAPQTAEQRDESLYATLLKQRNRLERWLGAIAMTASVSPLLGLLGTVSGMITTFKLMTLFGAGDASSVSAGISEALVTTELGLIVAIPALLTHALMSRKVRNIFSQLEDDAVHLSQLPVRELSA